MKPFLAIIFLGISSLLIAQNQPNQLDPPYWAKNAIWYQIFVERFYNGDKKNDPIAANINTLPMHQIAPAHWKLSRWTSDWYQREPWTRKLNGSFNDQIQFRRYGGDLKGILLKLNYLANLGVNALFLNPINDAPSMHKYDARNYHHVDIHFGPDPIGDLKIMATENPADPTTWKWTAADKLFLQLVNEAHKRGMKIIVDYSWNHVGTTFWAWQDVLKNQAASAYKNWFDILSFDNPSTIKNEFKYNGWLNIPHLPEIKKTNITSSRKAGLPYEGNINQEAKEHIFSVTNRWLAPNGDTSMGIDGFRLDVADQIGLGFWRDFRSFVRGIQPNAYLVGEIWWEEWPDQLMNPAPYVKGDIFDAVMFYQVYRPARSFFSNAQSTIDAAQFKDSLQFQWNRLRPATQLAMMNVSSSHDAPRLLSCFYNSGKYKFKATPKENPLYKTGKPTDDTYKRVQLYLVQLFTSIGAPQIWNGEEMGMWGADDPDCRKPLWWKEYTFDSETRNNYQVGKIVKDPVQFNQAQFDFYKKLIAIRKKYPALIDGSIEFLTTSGKQLSYVRKTSTQSIYVYFNASNKPVEFLLPNEQPFINLLQPSKSFTKKIILGALESAIVKSLK